MQVEEGVTHVVIHYRKEQQSQLFRAKDGMLIGMAAGAVVKFGANPLAGEQRLFINPEHAVAFLKEFVAKADLGLNEPVFEEREGEPTIVQPAPDQINTRQRPPRPDYN